MDAAQGRVPGAAKARIPEGRRRARIARQSLHPGHLEHHGSDIRGMPAAGSVRAQCLALAVEKLVELPQRLIARGGEIRFLLHFPAMHLDAGDEADHFVGGYSWIHECSSRYLLTLISLSTLVTPSTLRTRAIAWSMPVW